MKLPRAVILLLGATSCSSLLGLDVEYDEPEATGSSTATTSGGPTTTSVATGSTSAASTGGAGGSGTGGDGAEGPGGSGLGGAGGAGGAGGCSTTDERSDEFLDDTLDDKWTIHEADVEDFTGPTFEDDQLRLETDISQWYSNGDGGPFVYQVVEGDFLVWTRVRVTIDGVNPPTEDFHGASLLMREPQGVPGTTETFIMASVGVADDNGVCRLGATLDEEGDSAGVITAANDTECAAYLAICRKSGVTTVYAREIDDGPWVSIDFSAATPAPQLPDLVQVGPAAFAFEGGEHTIGDFEFVRFVPMCGADCETLVGGLEE